MSFGESKFSVGFIQKTISGDQNIKVNHTYSSCKQLQKALEDTKSHAPEADTKGMIGTGPPVPRPTHQSSPHYVGSPPP
jgi:hypothetical protein